MRLTARGLGAEASRVCTERERRRIARVDAVDSHLTTWRVDAKLSVHIPLGGHARTHICLVTFTLYVQNMRRIGQELQHGSLVRLGGDDIDELRVGD